MGKSDEITAERIFVALDTSPLGIAALEAAADLAAELQAELQGLFVEDVNLLRLAGLPFAREIALSSTAPRQLDLASMERTLRTKAEQVRHALANTAARASLPWSFQVARGHATRAILQAAANADLLIIGRENPRPKSTVSEAIAVKPPIVVVYDGSTAGQRALQAATRLNRNDTEEILVVATAADQEESKRLAEQGVQWLRSCGLRAAAGPSLGSDSTSFTDAARRWDARLMLINRDSPLLDEATIDRLVNELDCPIGLVR